jgi:hypothetical protein
MPVQSDSRTWSQRSATAGTFPGTNDWLKKTCGQRETLPIAGFSIKDKQFVGIY